jgi:hypothetical protein
MFLLPSQVCGLIDFGDMCHTWAVSEIAITALYVMLLVIEQQLQHQQQKDCEQQHNSVQRHVTELDSELQESANSSTHVEGFRISSVTRSQQWLSSLSPTKAALEAMRLVVVGTVPITCDNCTVRSNQMINKCLPHQK